MRKYGTDKTSDALVDSEYIEDRLTAAMRGYGLDKLLHDESKIVRAAVATKGYGLKHLMKDKEEMVRQAVAEQGYRLDIMIHDPSESVRKIVRNLLKQVRENMDTDIDIRILAQQILDEE